MSFRGKKNENCFNKKINKNLITFRFKSRIRLPEELVAVTDTSNTTNSDHNNKKFQPCLSELKIKMNYCGENERLIQKVH